jgi:hypothetical protein
MDRRCVSVSTSIVLAILTLAQLGAAATSSRSAKRRPSASINPAPSYTKARAKESRAGRAKKGCAPCAEIAKKSKNRASKKSASMAKDLPCHPKDYVDPRIARNYQAALRDMKRAGIKPRVTSVWRSSESQAQLHKCSLSNRCRRSNPGLYRALPAGQSIHEAGFAVDMAGIATGPRGNKRLTPQGRRIVAIMEKNGFNWRYGLADPVHFEADPRRHGYRSVKEAINRTQTTCQIRLAKSKPHKKPPAKVATNRGSGKSRLVAARNSAPVVHSGGSLNSPRVSTVAYKLPTKGRAATRPLRLN